MRSLRHGNEMIKVLERDNYGVVMQSLEVRIK